MRAKTILITGATAGIGRFAALHLLRRGHRVLASGRNAAALAALKTEAGALPLATLPLDVTDAAAVAAAAAAAQVQRPPARGGLHVPGTHARSGVLRPAD